MSLDRQQKNAIALALLPVVLIWQVNGIYLSALAQISVPLFWLADFIQWIILPGALLLLLAKKAVLPADYGLGMPAMRWQTGLLATLAVFVTTDLAFFLARKLAWRLLDQPGGFFDYPEVFPGGIMGGVIWLYSALTAGIIESIFFIGLPWLLYRHLSSRPSRVAFTLLVSVIFACAHWEQGPHIIVAALCFHLVACAWFFKLGTLWPVAAGHTLVDLVAFS